MCISTGDIVESCGSNPGGVAELYWALKKDILSIPAVSNDGVTVTGDIVMKSGKKMGKLDLPLDSTNFDETSAGDVTIGNVVLQPLVKGFIPRMTATIKKEFQNAIGVQLVVIVVTNDGNTYLLGNLKRGVIFTFKYSSGAKGSDKNGSEFEFKNDGMFNSAYLYTGVIPITAAA